MPSLIGSAPNQVPTNGMLGTMAFQDADNALVQNITVTGSSSVPTKTVTDNSTASASTAFVKESQKQKEAGTSTTGTGTAYVLSPTFSPSEYYTGQTFFVAFHAASGASPTININGLGAKNLVLRNSDGTFSNVGSGDLAVGMYAQIRYNGSAFEVTDIFPASASQAAAGTNSSKYLTASTLRSGLNASGSAPIYACRAWIKFNGTGTPSIVGSGNFSSITDNGTGNYTLNFTTSMPTDTYSVVASGGGNNASYSNLILGLPSGGVYTTAAIQVVATGGGGSTTADAPILCVAVFH